MFSTFVHQYLLNLSACERRRKEQNDAIRKNGPLSLNDWHSESRQIDFVNGTYVFDVFDVFTDYETDSAKKVIIYICFLLDVIGGRSDDHGGRRKSSKER